VATVVLLSMAAVFFGVLTLLYRCGAERDRKKARLDEVKTARSGETCSDRKKESAGLEWLRQMGSLLKSRQRNRVLGQQISNTRSKKKLSEAEKMLMIADVQLTGLQFMLVKLASAAVLASACRLCGGVLVRSTGMADRLVPTLTLCGGLLGEILPARWLKSRVAGRKALYREHLPDVMDLLVVSVEAGLGFDAALIRLYQKDKSPLMQELMRAMQDIQYGMTKREAYTNLSQRCGVKELTSFVNALIQADQMGISIRTVLKTQSESLREERRQRAEEKALKAPVKMLLPLVAFIFPVIFIIILGPAVMNVMEILG